MVLYMAHCKLAGSVEQKLVVLVLERALRSRSQPMLLFLLADPVQDFA
jgi:hypothetical protein